ncbi:hypothetical protein CsSME_00008223 [Camellia sinensis var. sinensis]
MEDEDLHQVDSVPDLALTSSTVSSIFGSDDVPSSSGDISAASSSFVETGVATCVVEEDLRSLPKPNANPTVVWHLRIRLLFGSNYAQNLPPFFFVSFLFLNIETEDQFFVLEFRFFAQP